jgi:hypothetical protein
MIGCKISEEAVMASSRQVVIMLAPEMVELVQKKISSGQYAN